MNLTIAIADYLDEKRPSLSPSTLRWYEHKLRHFAEWAAVTGEALETHQLKPATFARYLTHLEETDSIQFGRSRSSYTRRGYAQVFRQWADWLAANDLARPELRKQIVRPRADIKIICTFSNDQLAALFAAAKDQPNARLAARDTAILALLLDTGIRASELCGLRAEHVYFERAEPYIKVYGKGRKEREVGFGQKTRKALATYLHRHRFETNLPYAFLNGRAEQLTPDGLDQMLYRLRDRAGGPDVFTGIRVSAHTFRHTFAVRSLERGVDVYTLSRVLGHTSVVVTQGYLRDFSQRSARKQVGSLLDTM